MSVMTNIGPLGWRVLDQSPLRETRDGPGGRVSLPDHRLTPVGELGVPGDVRFRGSRRWGEGWALTGPRTPRIFRRWEVRVRQFGEMVIKKFWTALKGWWQVGTKWFPISPIEEEGGSWSVVPSSSKSRKNRREMRPAGGMRPCPPKIKNGPTVGVGNTQGKTSFGGG